MRLEIDALHFHVAKSKMPGPFREHTHDRTLRGRHAYEVKRGPLSGLKNRHRDTPSAAMTPRANNAATSCSVRGLYSGLGTLRHEPAPSSTIRSFMPFDCSMIA